MWPLPIVNPIVLRAVLAGAALIAAFIAGWTVEGWRWDASSAQEKEATVQRMQKLMEEKAALDAQVRALVSDAQAKDAKYASLYRKYKDEVNEATTGGRCYGPAAIELFNRAIASVSSGESHPAGVPQGSTASASDRDVLQSDLDLIKLYADCRNQVMNIIAWDEKTHNKKK